jgi:prolyl-tRNA synthetase
MGLKKEDLVEKRAIEVGNIFPLESKYTDALDVYYTDESGEKKSIIAGCYGIGVSRVMGVLAEIFSDEKGIVWPEAVAPFRVHLVILGNSPEVAVAGDLFYEKLKTLGVETLYDDRDLRPGEKFADSDLIGIPTRVVISEKTLQAGKLEVKKRTASEAEMMDESDFLKSL